MDDGRSPPGRGKIKSLASVLAPAILAAGLVVAIDRDPDPFAPATAAAPGPPTIDLGTSGVVVSLTKVGAGLSVGEGSTAAFHVGFASASPVTRVELWAEDSVVAGYEPAPDRLDGRPRLEWTPTEQGTRLLTARAYDGEGRVGLSNPVWVEVTEPTLTVVLDEDSVDDTVVPDAPDGPADRLGTTDPVSLRFDHLSGPARLQPLHPRAPPVLTAGTPVVDGCTVTTTADRGSTGDGDSVVVMMIPPGSTEMLPVAVLTGDDDSISTTLPAGSYGWITALSSEGLIKEWSPPTTTTVVGDDCRTPGWTSDENLRLRQGLLSPAATTGAYLYVEGRAGHWSRVPAEGTVRRSWSGNHYDFSPYLHSDADVSAFQAWGWEGGQLVYLGSAQRVPTQTDDPLVAWPITPTNGLWYLQPATDDQPEMKVWEGIIDVDPDDDLIGTHRFTWTHQSPGTTHGLVQVSFGKIPDDAGPHSDFVLFTCLVTTAGQFDIDFDAQTCTPAYSAPSSGPIDISTGQQGLYSTIVGVDLVSDPNVGTIDPLAALHKQLYDDPEMPPDAGIDWKGDRTIRVLPMAHSTWTGAATNQVTLEFDKTPVAPPGVPEYEIDVKLISPPRAPRFDYMGCWHFVGWTDPEKAENLSNLGQFAVNAAFQQGGSMAAMTAANQHPHFFWSMVMDVVGPGPICPGCPKVGFGPYVATVWLGGADCSTSSSFLSDPLGWAYGNILGPIVEVFKALVDLASDGFAYLKSQAVEGLMQMTGCTGSVCKVIAESVINGVLIAVGVPPTLPNFDQLVQIGKGELVSAAMELAKAAGVPCDEANMVASMPGTPNLTCEGLIEAFLDEATAAINQSFVDAANSTGYGFHPEMIVKPWWAGQPGLTEVEITVNPTKYTAEAQGLTCPIGVISTAKWTAPSLTHDIPGIGPATLPKTEWDTLAYEIQWLDLPDLGQSGPGANAPYLPATKRFTLFPVSEQDMVTVTRLPQHVLQAPKDFTVSPYTFLFHPGATFSFAIGGSCADGETHVYQLNGTAYPTLVSIEEW